MLRPLTRSLLAAVSNSMFSTARVSVVRTRLLAVDPVALSVCTFLRILIRCCSKLALYSSLLPYCRRSEAVVDGNEVVDVPHVFGFIGDQRDGSRSEKLAFVGDFLAAGALPRSVFVANVFVDELHSLLIRIVYP